MFVSDLESIKIKLASSEEILDWSHGEVTKPETINYRTQRPEKDGLFCEKIFGPTKDYECYCGKYKRIRYKGIVCDRCGVEVTKSSVRRERMGHIKLAACVSHVWFLKGVPSRIGLILDLPFHKVEEVIYFISNIVISVDEQAKKKVLEEIEKEYQTKVKSSTFALRVSVDRPCLPAGRQVKVQKELKKILEELKQARDRAKEEVLSIEPKKVLTEIEYHRLSLKYGEIFEAETGAEVLKQIAEKINLDKEIKKLEGLLIKKSSLEEQKKTLKRINLFRELKKAGVRPEWMFLEVLPVLPPDLRPMVQLDGGRYASSDLNDLYRRVINRNNRLKYLLEINAPEVIIRNEKRMLQEAVDALIDNKMRRGTTTLATTGGRRLLKSLADMLQGKQGRFRQNLLGKRVDYSGRSVIVVGPELEFSQCGVPKKMALELFKPFVIQKLIEKKLAYNMGGGKKLLEEETDEVWESLEEVVKERLVLLNRAPTLHRLGVQAFYPILIEGEAIRLHPLACAAFNADFDGDQMAIHLPLSQEAQTEAKGRIFSCSNLLKPVTGEPVVAPTKDIVLGCYYLTKIIQGQKGEGKVFSSFEEAILAYEAKIVTLNSKIKALFGKEFIETSVGRIIFNQVLPQGFGFQNYLMDSKNLKKLVKEIIEKYSKDSYRILDKIKDLGFEYSTESGITLGMDDLVVPKEKEKLIKAAEEKTETIQSYYQKGLFSQAEKILQVIEVWKGVKTEIEKLIPKTLPLLGPVFFIIDSGARGSWSQLVQMTGMKGLVANPAGRIIELPLKSSFKEGFDVLEYFISTHGARKGTVDTALRTATAGYLTRRLVDVAHEAIVMEEDCHDKEGILMYRKDADDVSQDFTFKILGRVSLERIKNPKTHASIVKKGEIIDWKAAKEIVQTKIEKVRVRSPLSCKSPRGICRKCYGMDLGWGGLIKLGEAVGVIAAQAIGEPGTQLTLRTFHTGGVVGEIDITRGLPRVDEIFERRPPKGEAEMCAKAGTVVSVDEEKRVIKIASLVSGKKEKEALMEYYIPAKVEILVKPGQLIEAGNPLYVGSLDLKKLFRLVGKTETQRYMTKEIQRVYASQGVSIHDKHIELIVRQMFSRVKIRDPGNSLFGPEEIISSSQFIEENQRLKKQKLKRIKAQELLLGISKVALTTDSFLSAASFQQTSKVLIGAALRGEEDKLRGLKENVIIGKLIPVGTGFKTY